MSFNIKLYRNTSPKNAINKSISEVASIDGVLKQECSITAPVILYGGDYVAFNYAYIPSFGRYYFLTDMISVRNGLWEMYFSVDPLFSFKDEILSNSCILERQQYLYNMYIQDQQIPLQENDFVTTARLTGGKSFRNNANFVLSTQ